MKRPGRFPAGEPHKKPGILAELAMTIGVLAFYLIIYTLLDRHVIGAGMALVIIVAAVALFTFLARTYLRDGRGNRASDREACPPPPDVRAMLSRLGHEKDAGPDES